MTEDIYLTAYRSAFSELVRNCELTPEEWTALPALLRDNLNALIRDGQTDPAQITVALVGIIRQKEQVKRSAKRLGV